MQVANADPNVRLVVANSQWTRGVILEAYKKRLNFEFDAEVQPLTEAGPINDWVSTKTNGCVVHRKSVLVHRHACGHRVT